MCKDTHTHAHNHMCFYAFNSAKMTILSTPGFSALFSKKDISYPALLSIDPWLRCCGSRTSGAGGQTSWTTERMTVVDIVNLMRLFKLIKMMKHPIVLHSNTHTREVIRVLQFWTNRGWALKAWRTFCWLITYESNSLITFYWTQWFKFSQHRVTSERLRRWDS